MQLKLNQNHLKLDNPVLYSLREVHADKSFDEKGYKFYDPKFCPFGGVENEDASAAGISNYSTHCNRFFVVGKKPAYDTAKLAVKNLVCQQMVLHSNIGIECQEEIVSLENEEQHKDLFELVNLVQPGYFMPKTAELGKYYGIYKGTKLVAVGGERMKMQDYTEISAIVTHPDYVRRWYAKQLIKKVTDQIFLEGKIPYLHVVETNNKAIQLYEKLGFYSRRKISFWQFSSL